MIYVYDVLLNFNDELIEFFEWLDTDNIKYAKKISLFKIKSSIMNDFLYNEIELDDSFVKDTLRYEFNGNSDKVSYTLFSDGKIVLGVLIRDNKIEMVSRLIIDEEDEVLDMIRDVDFFNISYKILKKRNLLKRYVTREQQVLKNKLINEIKCLLVNKDYDKLRYLYYEATGKECFDINNIYNKLISGLDDITEIHEKLYNILKMSNQNN